MPRADDRSTGSPEPARLRLSLSLPPYFSLPAVLRAHAFMRLSPESAPPALSPSCLSLSPIRAACARVYALITGISAAPARSVLQGAEARTRGRSPSVPLRPPAARTVSPRPDPLRPDPSLPQSELHVLRLSPRNRACAVPSAAPGCSCGRPTRRDGLEPLGPLRFPCAAWPCVPTCSSSPGPLRVRSFQGGLCERALADRQPRSLDLPAWVG